MMFTGAVILCVWLIGCDDDNRYITGPVIPKDYVVYVSWDYPWPTVTTYNTGTGTIDSFHTPYVASAPPSLSADGRLMYFGSQTTAVIELDSYTTVMELPYDGRSGVVASPDNQLVAIQSEELYILNTADFSVAYHDTTRLVNGQFSADSRNFYCCHPYGDTSFVVKINVKDSTSSWKAFPGEIVQLVIPTNDEQKLLMQFWATIYPVLKIYDVGADSVLFTDTIPDGWEDSELTPNGRYLLITHRGNPYSVNPSPLAIRVYDVWQNQLHKIISTSVTDVPGTPHYLDYHVYDLCLTPDGRLGVGTTRTDYLVLIDMQQMEMTGIVQLDTMWSYTRATCQLIP
ncbi:MAG: hypothetical protein ABII79_01885 [bacterium]